LIAGRKRKKKEGEEGRGRPPQSSLLMASGRVEERKKRKRVCILLGRCEKKGKKERRLRSVGKKRGKKGKRRTARGRIGSLHRNVPAAWKRKKTTTPEEDEKKEKKRKKERDHAPSAFGEEEREEKGNNRGSTICSHTADRPKKEMTSRWVRDFSFSLASGGRRPSRRKKCRRHLHSDSHREKAPPRPLTGKKRGCRTTIYLVGEKKKGKDAPPSPT